MLTIPLTDIRELNARAVRTSVAVVSEVTAAHVDRATPCADWTLGQLLAHMTAQHRGFAAAAAGDGAELAHWEARPLGDDPASAYAAAATRVLAAFADEQLAADFQLPELTTSRTFPAARAIGFHFIDYVVHSWDVARALGRPVTFDADVLGTALAMARDIPDGPNRLVPGAAFAPAVPAPPEAGPLDQVLALLGRPPVWPDA